MFNEEQPTNYLLRFGDALQALCGGVRPSDKLMLQWLQNVNEQLQEFAVNHCPIWATGIGVIEAAQVAADNPTEGVNHETLQELLDANPI